MDELLERNRTFAARADTSQLPPLPRHRCVILACLDARVDPAVIFGLELGEAVVIRNNGGRATNQVCEEVAALAFLVGTMDEGDEPGPFELIIMQHTQCGAERMADPAAQAMVRQSIGIDVSEWAIANHEADLEVDVAKLKAHPSIPDHIVVSTYLFEMETGLAHCVTPPRRLR